MCDEVIVYEAASSFVLFHLEQGLVLAAGAQPLQLDGDSAALIEAVALQLRQPRRLDQLADALGGEVDDEELAAALEWLCEQGFVRVRPEHGALRYPPLSADPGGSCLVVGEPSHTAAVASALGTLGLSVRQLTTAEAWRETAAPPSLVVGVFDSLFDPAIRRLNELALRRAVPFVPVVGDGRRVLIGPLVEVGGPCASCCALRLLADIDRGWQTLELWHVTAEAQSFTAPALFASEQVATRVAETLRCFLLALDAEGAIQGDRHGLYRLELDSGLTAVHHLVRHSWCPSCAVAVEPLRPGDSARLERERAQVVARWREILVDDRDCLPPEPGIVRKYQDPVTGLLHHSEEWSGRQGYFRGLPELWGGPRVARGREFLSWRQGINGTGPSLDHRRLICISEGVERYAQYTHHAAIEAVPFKDLEAVAIDPREISLYQEAQYTLPGFPRPRFEPELPLNWSWGYGMLSGAAKLFPVELVTMYLSDATYPGRLVTQPLSSGGASHVSYRRAILNGLRELIERDAHMIAWYKQIALRQVRLPRRVGDPYADDLLAFLDSVDMDFRVFDLALDFPIPTFLTVGRMRKTVGSLEKGGLIFVATADLGRSAALGRGLCETAIHYETLCLNPDPAKDYRNHPYDQDDQSQGWDNWWPTYLHYLNPANAAQIEASFFAAGDEVSYEEIPDCGSGDPEADLDWLLQRFAERGLEPFVWDLVSDEIRETRFRVVKTVVPGLIPLTASYQSRRLSSPRLEQVAAAVGRAQLPPGETFGRSHPNA